MNRTNFFGVVLWLVGIVGLIGIFRGVAMEFSRPMTTEDKLLLLDLKPYALHEVIARSTTEAVTFLTVVNPSSTGDFPAPFPGGISADRAIALALFSSPNASVTQIRLKRERGILAYRIDFNDNTRVLMDARSGQILEISHRTQAEEEEENWLIQGILPTIQIQEAIQIALTLYPDAMFENAELDLEDMLLLYEIELDNKVTLYIDATTGSLITVDKD